MFDWLKNISDKVKSLNVSVDNYKEETGNQTMPAIAYVNQAKKLIDESRFEEAKVALNNALSLTEKDPLVYKYLGICEERTGNLDGAIAYFKKSASINPQDKNIWHKLGLAEINKRDFENAEKSFEEANKVSPLNTDIQTGWGMALFKQKKYVEALEKFTNALKVNRYNFSAMLLAAISEVRLGKYDDAEKKLKFLISANANEGCMYEYANLHFLKEDYDTAINYAQKSLLYNPTMLPAYLLLGKIYSMKFDYENSMKFLSQALAQNLASPALFVEWADALVRLYRFYEAKEFYQKALEYDVNLVEAQNGMALCSALTGDLDKAHELLSVIDNTEKLYETKGVLEYNYGNTEEAINLFKNALKENPKSNYVYFLLAKCYEKLGNANMVKDSYDKLTKFNDKFADGFLEYAKYLISQNDFKDAQRKLRKANKIEENNQEILNLLFYTSYILVKENICEYNVKEAIAVADKIKNLDYPEYKAELEEILKNLNK